MAAAGRGRTFADDTLRKFADRIQAHAIRRCGELLKAFDKGVGRPRKNGAGSDTFTQRGAAAKAGLSKRQEVTASRVAKVPAEKFEAAVESDDPPTVTTLAKWGTKSQPVPEGFKEATALLGTVRRFAEFCNENNPTAVAAGVRESRSHSARWMASAGSLGQLPHVR